MHSRNFWETGRWRDVTRRGLTTVLVLGLFLAMGSTTTMAQVQNGTAPEEAAAHHLDDAPLVASHDGMQQPAPHSLAGNTTKTSTTADPTLASGPASMTPIDTGQRVNAPANQQQGSHDLASATETGNPEQDASGVPLHDYGGPAGTNAEDGDPPTAINDPLKMPNGAMVRLNPDGTLEFCVEFCDATGAANIDYGGVPVATTEKPAATAKQQTANADTGPPHPFLDGPLDVNKPEQPPAPQVAIDWETMPAVPPDVGVQQPADRRSANATTAWAQNGNDDYGGGWGMNPTASNEAGNLETTATACTDQNCACPHHHTGLG